MKDLHISYQAHREMAAVRKGRPMKLTRANGSEGVARKILTDEKTEKALELAMERVRELLNLEVSVPILFSAAMQTFTENLGTVQFNLETATTPDKRERALIVSHQIRLHLYKVAGQKMGERNDKRERNEKRERKG
jgi:hypothetical protein